MPVPNLHDVDGVELLAVRDAVSVHGERWVQIQAMVDRRRFVSFEMPRFYLDGFNSDMALSHWLCQSARGQAEQANSEQGDGYVRAGT